MKMWTKEEFVNHDVWYHATEDVFFSKILSEGIIANINADTPTDFGFGLYLCPSLEWARKYAKAFRHGIIIEFHFSPLELIKNHSELKYQFYGELNNEFADFVFDNRKHYSEHLTKCVHDYCFVGGVMSDGQQISDFREYDNKLIDKQELYRRLLEPKEDWQLLLHSQELCDLIKPYDAFDLGGVHYDVASYAPYKRTNNVV